ncbi:hypothetical protein V4U87_04005 [Methanobrevibacter gottschalkii]
MFIISTSEKINTEVKKLHVKSPEFVKIENDKNELKSELKRIMADINSFKGIIGK